MKFQEETMFTPINNDSRMFRDGAVGGNSESEAKRETRGTFGQTSGIATIHATQIVAYHTARPYNEYAAATLEKVILDELLMIFTNLLLNTRVSIILQHSSSDCFWDTIHLEKIWSTFL